MVLALRYIVDLTFHRATLNCVTGKKFTNLIIRCFVKQGRSHKTFNLLTLFCKPDHFINAYNNCHSAVKRPSLQTRVSKLPPKKFCEIHSRLRIHIIFLSIFLLKLVKYKFVKNLLDFLGNCSSKKLFVNAIILNNLSYIKVVKNHSKAVLREHSKWLWGVTYFLTM